MLLIFATSAKYLSFSDLLSKHILLHEELNMVEERGDILPYLQFRDPKVGQLLENIRGIVNRLKFSKDIHEISFKISNSNNEALIILISDKGQIQLFSLMKKSTTSPELTLWRRNYRSFLY